MPSSKLSFMDRDKLDAFRTDVIILLLKNERRTATEKIVKLIESTSYIYTTRDDEKSEMWIYDRGIYIPQGKTFIREICREILENSYTTHIASEIIAKIEADTYIESQDFFNKRYKNLIAVENGILDVITGKLKPFDPKIIMFSRIPVRFNPTKTCKDIIRFFNDILKSDIDIDAMQELFGFVLLNEYRIETAFMFTADGRNGKSKAVEVIKRFVGTNNCTNRTINDIEKDNFARGDLINKMANLCGDMSSDEITQSGWFKALVGRDLISAPRKFKTTVEFTNYAKMIFSTNELPRVRTDSLGFWSKWVVFTFPYTFLTQSEIDKYPEDSRTNLKLIDPDIIDKITDEDQMSGLLNWALIGLKRLLKNRKFSTSESSEDIKIMWTRKANSLKAFIQDYTIEDIDGEISKQEFLRAYIQYCRKNKLRKMGDKAIHHNLMIECGAFEEQKMYKGSMTRCWTGIKLKDKIISIDKDSNKDKKTQ